MDLFITFQSELISVYSSLDTSICVDYKFRANRMNFIETLDNFLHSRLRCAISISFICTSSLCFVYLSLFSGILVWNNFFIIFILRCCSFFILSVLFFRIYDFIPFTVDRIAAGCLAPLPDSPRDISRANSKNITFFLLGRKLKFLWERVTILIFSDDDYLMLEISEKMQSSASTGNEQRRFFSDWISSSFASWDVLLSLVFTRYLNSPHASTH